MVFRILLFFILFSSINLAGQDFLRYDNHDYTNHIKSVRFHLSGLPTYYPIVALQGEMGDLTLRFDDMDGDVKTYRYTVIHCDANWEPTNLSYFEYLDRFEEGDINNFELSYQTEREYTHYWLYLPNRDISWTLSGNYLLYVYEENRNNPVFTRRFIVAEQAVDIIPRMSIPADVYKNKTHQEIDFDVKHEGFEYRNAKTEISATIMQNGRWDNAVINIPPFMERGDQTIDFNYQNKIVFEAGREWRQIDLRSLRFPSADVSAVQRHDDGYYITLLKDLKRYGNPYSGYNDLNGGYIVENRDFNDDELTAEYCKVLFQLYSPTIYRDKDIYLFGAMSNYQLQPEFKAAYNDKLKSYVAAPVIKQGFYSYSYVMVDEEGVADFDTLEGNTYETENEYTIIVYFHPFGARYDRVIGVKTFESNR